MAFLLNSGFGQTFVDKLLEMLRSEIFIVFIVLALGYLVGRISIKGVAFGSSGVFIIALIAGILLRQFGDKLGFTWIPNADLTSIDKEYKAALKTVSTIQNIGLVMFVTSIGFISGPTFIRNFKKKAGSFLTISVVINIVAVAICVIIVRIDPNLNAAKGAGILMGALSTTPGLSAAKDFFSTSQDSVMALSGLAYPFGVLGVVLFVQVMPKLLRKDMAAEVAKLRAAIDGQAKSVSQTTVDENGEMAEIKKLPPKRIKIDSMGICAFAAAAALGMILGSFTFLLGGSGKFYLGMTGGALIMGLLFGHFNHIGKISLEVPTATLKTVRELGLVLFLASTGIEGGLNFLKAFAWIYLLYGAIMTIVPMVAGYLIGKFAFKMELLNNLGTICGSMTSTPALGSLIHVSGTEDVAHSYAAAYPISLFMLVFVPQIINFLC